MEIDLCPRWVLSKLGVPQRNQLHFSLLISALFALAVVPVAACIPHFCLMHRFLGIPCPGCGILHSMMAILTLNPAAGWNSNPAGFVVALGLGFQLVARPVAILMPHTGESVCVASEFISKLGLASLLSVWILRLI
jgi:Protein of unknown function (DUF2752)